jgi:hypothetical protein
MLNPITATITLTPPNAAQFRLQYHFAGDVIAEQVVTASSPSGDNYGQSLASLNALVDGNHQATDLVLTASAINAGGESTATACAEIIQVVNAPNAPSSVTVSN